MNLNEKYSVLISVYYKEKPEYLALSLDSMLGQTIKPDEIVVVKDGPLNNELDELINNYSKKYEGIIKVVKSDENIGLGRALNLGLKNCKNELVARMDTDDISLPSRCESQLKVFLNNEELAIVGTGIDEFYNNPNEIISSRIVPTTHNEIYQFAKRRSAFNHPTVMYKKSKVLEVGGYKDLKRNQDVDLFGRMLFNGYKAANLEESLLLFRSNEDLTKRRKSWENTKSYISVIRSLYKIGYSSYRDYLIVMVAQTGMFLCPAKAQNWVYKKFLRK
ncbi:glycosyltransferase [Paraclostridium sordellii]|uniref:glycosyltransferase n=1 Tax=Paraclostridium sordellii TaxID=1505 RepID=UPI0005E6CC55|nr:glycosyltransferase [Paeniclostridium sordellii]CEN21621.1 glycosyl transferase family protein [[Clostridium] sordellii] [Paeniclostridium sordellii]CEP97210.1 glycosyl transferase family protein [[Clostridium] sordellii] [Paeniclostridium sordellii]